VSAPTAAASSGSTRAEVNAAQDQVERWRSILDRLDADLAGGRQRLNRVNEQLAREEGVLGRLGVQRLRARRRLLSTRRHLEAVHRRTDRRAAEAYMLGPGSGLDLALGASSLADLSDRLAYLDAIGARDAQRARRLERLEQRLLLAQRRLKILEQRRSDAFAAARRERRAILADLALSNGLRDQVETSYQQAESVYTDAQRAFERQRRQLRRERRRWRKGLDPHSTLPIPAGYEGVLRVCPVGEPVSFGDGFGAPRYAGGYHLHAGVDMLAPFGTPIYAPFDGIARSSWNTLGGNSVFVQGAAGYAYNAHLLRFSPLSDGPVKAGDVIGYVGDTGDAKGTPHDHFEFHPAQMPTTWVPSAYGYAKIGSAINPYPLLLRVCP
jgi:murein DD-endopeptidase MepM/ murein hydrolase activator NlpD/DNA-directed RNA polymerase subunit N (RpoN/RPB10)